MTLPPTRPVDANGLTFDVRVAGPDDGVPVVLLHGFPETSAAWGDVAPELAADGHRVIAPDQRGYSPGARPDGVDAYATDHLVDDVLAIADALDVDRFHLVGHDWGASVAWVLAARRPERLRSLTAFSVPHLAAYNRALREDPDAQQRASYIGLFRQDRAADLLLEDDATRLRAMYAGAVPADQVETYVRHLGEPGAMRAALHWYGAMTPALGDLPPVRVPTTFVWSDGDSAIGRAGADACGEHVEADYRYVVLEGVTHWIPEQAPEAVLAAVRARIAASTDPGA